MTDHSLLQVYTEAPDQGLFISFRFYTEAPNISGGGGGWLSVPRPQDTALTAWRGPTDAYTMELNLIMDCFTASTANGQRPDIENDCRTLEKMCGALTSPVVQPPLLILNAHGALQNDAYHFPPLRWIIPEPPTYSEVNRNEWGQRTRQVVTIKFMKYTAYDELTRSKSTGTSHLANQFVARTGDTWKKVAAQYLKQYGGAKWANRLAKFNNPSWNSSSTLIVGRAYKLPTQTVIAQWGQTASR